MTELEINQLLHERVMGECWHEYLHGICIKCGRWSNHGGMISANWNPSYTSSWADYGRLLEVAMTKEWWIAFTASSFHSYLQDNPGMDGVDIAFWFEAVLLNPLLGSTAMAEFVKARGI